MKRVRYIKHKLTSTSGKSWSIYIMRSDGKSFCRVYFFNNDKAYGCLDNLSVHPSIRKCGEATKLQIMREKMIKKRGGRDAYLWVKTGTWMEKWYKRRGYRFSKKHKSEKGCIWMRKRLK